MLLLSQGQVENLVVVVQACLAMQLEGGTKHALLIVHCAVADSSQARMGCSHGTHGTRLLDHVAVKACTQVRPAAHHTPKTCSAFFTLIKKNK